MTDLSHLPEAIRKAIDEYDRKVAAGIISFGPNGHKDSLVTATWIPAWEVERVAQGF